MIDKCEGCDWFSGQRDQNNEIVITYCSHPRNSSNDEGNTTRDLCPLLFRTTDDVESNTVDIMKIQKFAEMAELYAEVGYNVPSHSTEEVGKISKLNDACEYSAIDLLYNEDGKETSEEMLMDNFGVSLGQINEWADEVGYKRVILL